MARQSKMVQIELDHGKPIREILKEEFQLHGTQIAVAASLGIGQGTLNTWLLKLRMKQETMLVDETQMMLPGVEL